MSAKLILINGNKKAKKSSPPKKVKATKPDAPKPSDKRETPVKFLRRMIRELTTGQYKDRKLTNALVVLDGPESEMFIKQSNNVGRVQQIELLEYAKLYTMGYRIAD